MEFLRDRMIEHGKCKGLNLGLNLKRGGPTISVGLHRVAPPRSA